MFNLNWKTACAIYAILEPFILRLLDREVPKRVTKLYDNLARYSQPAVDSLFKLKAKVKETKNQTDNNCFEIGVNALEAFANYLLKQVEALRSE